MLQTERIAMIGGSFNPVTLAHIELGQIVKRELGSGCRVMYVPAPDCFLESWKEMAAKDILTGAQRLELIRLAAAPHGFECSDCELAGRTSGKTHDTLRYLSSQNGGARLCYVCGSDKLPELYRWYQAEQLVSENDFFIIPRGEDSPEEMIAESELLCRYKSHFVISRSKRKYPDMSATKVRESIKARDGRWKGMVPAETIKALERMVGQWQQAAADL